MLRLQEFFLVATAFSLTLIFSSIFSSLATSAVSLTCSPCTTTECKCTTNCTSGYFKIYSTSSCAGIAKKSIVISNGNVTFAPTATTYVKILCSDDTVSQCYNISPSIQTTTTTTTTRAPTTTTTTPSLANCIYECCISEPGYKNKFCAAGETCTNNVCVSAKSDCPSECCVDEADYNDKFCDGDATCVDGKCVSPGPNIPYSTIGIIAVAIVVGVLAFYFLRGRLSGGSGGTKGGDAYEALKRKWARRGR